jgi:GNAT superfamily N-acetyltransferase
MIRELNTSELSALLELYTHLHASDAPLPSQDVLDQTWDTIQKDPSQKCFGAFVDDTLVSSCTLSVIPNLTRDCRPYGVIENVVTHPEFRRHGRGRSVLQHALGYAWSMGCYKVMLLTGRKDEGTYRFYESAGFDRNAKQAFVAKPQKAEQSLPEVTFQSALNAASEASEA